MTRASRRAARLLAIRPKHVLELRLRKLVQQIGRRRLRRRAGRSACPVARRSGTRTPDPRLSSCGLESPRSNTTPSIGSSRRSWMSLKLLCMSLNRPREGLEPLRRRRYRIRVRIQPHQQPVRRRPLQQPEAVPPAAERAVQRAVPDVRPGLQRVQHGRRTARSCGRARLHAPGARSSRARCSASSALSRSVSARSRCHCSRDQTSIRSASPTTTTSVSMAA